MLIAAPPMVDLPVCQVEYKYMAEIRQLVGPVRGQLDSITTEMRDETADPLQLFGALRGQVDTTRTEMRLAESQTPVNFRINYDTPGICR
ncbi:unnamed protein product [Vitrella brassicaformis CCMP3155]|uniref:Uncharacterized protein n=1 Tax=Vitrella brassicaformis (strain CCMP3155) TaxID=1169540 RepID=A0A0G4EF12_VITBC|nr:unnamed protein product [Vitrella brassicaformis CCMP3155]|eukprot:CEL94303.1 unnamed protein product [Vitrella brassicaformis CCMP3155]